jgi:rhodanese-related sulfurtransferase
MSIPQISPAEAKRHLEAGTAVLIDVREPAEYARENIADARLVPLSVFGPDKFARERAASTAIIFHCQSGNRTCMNFEKLEAVGLPDIFVLEGGLGGWKQAGLPTRLDRKQPIELQRQVMIAAGSLILTGLVLAYLVSSWFIALSAFMGCGLVFAGVTGRCGLAALLMLMPWNKAATAKA